MAGSIEVLIKSRFNSERCARWFADDPEVDTLLELATGGAVIDVFSESIPNTQAEKPKPLLKRLRHVILKHAADLQSKGQALLLLLELAKSCGLHFSPVH